MAATSDNNFVMEAREEEMTSPLMNTQSSRRFAYFLRPSVTCVDLPVFEPPMDSVKPTISSTPVSLKLTFAWWRHPMNDWISWVNRMKSLHHSTWKQAGIYDAIMNSTYKIHSNDDLIIGFAEKWCSKTNTFVFPWGEATITLEDVMIIGGFSVLGKSVKTTLEDGAETIVQKLLDELSRLKSGKVVKPSQKTWMTRFKDRGSEIEHEAFLAYWLSRYVFPNGLPLGRDFILETIFPIAVYLARGTRIALAPAVLASLYKNLRSLKGAMTAATRNLEARGEIKFLNVEIKAPFQLVQVWAWERFPSLRPERNMTCGRPRLALWDGLKKKGLGNVAPALDRAEEEFIWRPYTRALNNFFPEMVYKDEEHWVSVNSGSGDKLEELIRCLRTSELVNHEVNCIEQYLPHRVAMQFGMDQDLPGCVARFNGSFDIAWKNYTRQVGDLVMYVPALLSKSGVTTRYMEWWKKLKLASPGMTEACTGENTTLGGSQSIEMKDDFGFPPMVDSMNTGVSGTNDKEKVVENFQVEGNGISSSSGANDKEIVVENFQVEGDRISLSSAQNEADFLGNGDSEISKRNPVETFSGTKSVADALIPLGFSPKRAMVEVDSSGLKDKETVSKNFQVEGNGASSSAHNEVEFLGHAVSEMSKKKPAGSFSGTKSVDDALIPPGFSPKHARVEENEIGVMDKETGVELPEGKNSGNRSKILEPPGMMLEERICRIEKLCALLKSRKLRS